MSVLTSGGPVSLMDQQEPDQSRPIFMFNYCVVSSGRKD